MQFNDAESVMKDCEAEGHEVVRLLSIAVEGTENPADDRTYAVAVKGPVKPAELDDLKVIADAHGAGFEEHERGNVVIA